MERLKLKRVANIAVKHVFNVADIANEVIIDTDFMIFQGINLHMGQQIMAWCDMEVQLYDGYENRRHERKPFADDEEKFHHDLRH